MAEPRMCSALCEDVERDRDQLEADVTELVALASEILANFHERGHPGEPCTRTGWVRDRTLREWRDRLADLTRPPDPPAG